MTMPPPEKYRSNQAKWNDFAHESVALWNGACCQEFFSVLPFSDCFIAEPNIGESLNCAELEKFMVGKIPQSLQRE
ncbi:hypothetical protein ACFS07_19065 [Undibacterium arcticum]